MYRSNSPRALAVGENRAARPNVEGVPGLVLFMDYRPEPPVAGEVCDLGSSGYFGFVRDNYVVDIYASPVVDGKELRPDAVTGQKVRELAKKIDEYLLKAPAKGIEDEWLPRIEAVSVVLPGPVVGRAFKMDARVSLHGKPCPTGRMQFDWRLFRKEELRHQVLYSAKQKTQPEPTSVLYTVDRPGWWEVQCAVSYDGSSPMDSREMLLYVAPSEEEPAAEGHE